jgi:hypothetical protein
MTDYRAWVVGPDGHFHPLEIITDLNDETAVEAAKRFANGSGVKVWDLDRKVAVLSPEGCHRPELTISRCRRLSFLVSEERMR